MNLYGIRLDGRIYVTKWHVPFKTTLNHLIEQKKSYSEASALKKFIHSIRKRFKMLKIPFFILCISSAFIINPIKLICAEENTVFLYNRIENCKSSEYYDVNYFVCHECDAQSNLTPSKNGKVQQLCVLVVLRK